MNSIRLFVCPFVIMFALFFGMSVSAVELCAIPPEAQLEDTSSPDILVGDGTPASCTSAAFVAAVARGGIITFDCGPDPITITLAETAKVYNRVAGIDVEQVVIDGGDKVTLSGGGVRRILYMNTCDQNLVWTTDHCQNQSKPRLTVQNVTFRNADSTGQEYAGGGAIWVRGGRFKILNCRFYQNVCDLQGPDVGGAAARVFSQYNGLPVYVVNSVFGGASGLGNIASNGGGLSSIGVSWTVINSLFSHNEAVGWGANPAQPGTPGGGNGGAICLDGNTFTLNICGTSIYDNPANEGGGAIFFVSNNRTGTLNIENAALWDNPSYGFETQGYPGIFYLGTNNNIPNVTNSTLGDPPATHPVAIDVSGDGQIGVAEAIHAAQVATQQRPEEMSPYVRKHADVIYDHRVDLPDATKGLQVLSNEP